MDQFDQVIDVLASRQRDLAAARRFFTRALGRAARPVEVATDRAAASPRVLDELAPAARYLVARCANNPSEADHGRWTARRRPMPGFKRLRSAAVVAAGQAFVQNVRRGHYELAVDLSPKDRVSAAFTELALAI